MRARSQLRARIYSALCSERGTRLRRQVAEAGRRLRGGRHVVRVFLQLDDPYSYLLSGYLDELRSHYDIELCLSLTEAVAGDFRPAADLYHEYALRDCRRLARELGIPFLDQGPTPPVEHRRALLDALAARVDREDFADELLAAIAAFWRGDAESVARRAVSDAEFGSANRMLAENRRRLQKLGHYDTATIHYGGEWYRGVDRLHYLVSRLDALGAAREPGIAPRIASIRQVMRTRLPIAPPGAASRLPPIELFYSLRSPYSWLLLQRLIRIADAFAVPLQLRPILPMVMRGLSVPAAKQRYILFDAAREARQHDVPFARFADPLGAGVERGMAVWQYARREKRERDFLVSAGNAIWSQGIDLATDEGLRKVTAKAGLFWPDALASLADSSWQELAEDNRVSLLESGGWGVPSVRIGDWMTWGQDRDWLVARHLEELCDNGEGIVV